VTLSKQVSSYVLSIVVVAALLAGGCRSTTATTQSAPAGPVQVSTTEPGVIPTGTALSVRTNQTISSSETGKTFTAEIAQDITNQSGEVLVPKGSPAELVILETDSGGAVGTRTVELGLRSVTVGGKKLDVTSAGVTQKGQEGLGTNRRTAEMVGGGAVIGTIIGAVVGGGEGAAIGAAAGAATGAAAQVLTRGKEVNVPAETVLSFRLNQPLNVAS
jgi:hypothetical protein